MIRTEWWKIITDKVCFHGSFVFGLEMSESFLSRNVRFSYIATGPQLKMIFASIRVIFLFPLVAKTTFMEFQINCYWIIWNRILFKKENDKSVKPACWMPASELHESSHTEGCNQMMFLWCPWDKSSISSFKWAHYRKHIHDIQMHISVIIIWVCLTSSVPWLSVALSNVCLLKFKNETLSGSTINDSIITLLYSSNPNQMLVFRFMLPSSGSSSSKVCSLSVR